MYNVQKVLKIKGNRLVGAVGIELVGQSLSLAESTALTPLHPSKTLLGRRILATSWPQILLQNLTRNTRNLPPLGNASNGAKRVVNHAAM